MNNLSDIVELSDIYIFIYLLQLFVLEGNL